MISSLINQGWRYHDIMWGVSWANIMLIMKDTQAIDYHSKDTTSQPSAQNEDKVLDLSNAADVAKLKSMAR